MTGPSRPLALSLGDPAGIGPEITLKAWRALCSDGPVFALIGDHPILHDQAERLGLPAPQRIARLSEADTVFGSALPVLPLDEINVPTIQPGIPSPDQAPLVCASIERGVTLALSGEAAGLVTCPIAKSVLYEAGFRFPGHTEYLADLTRHAPMNGPRGPVMMLANAHLRVVLTSIHVSLRDALSAMTAERVIELARLTHHALQQDFGIARPRLALAGLNPHAGEDGALGREEIEILNPAAERLRSEGIDISDARPPDTLFHADARQGYDVVLCQYHDQGLIPVKTLDFHGGVNVTLGLPIIRTSPDHGTAFDRAGQLTARPDSLIAALRQADTLARHRHDA